MPGTSSQSSGPVGVGAVGPLRLLQCKRGPGKTLDKPCVLSARTLWLSPWTVARLLCPWDSPSKKTGVGCHTLLQGIFLTQGSTHVPRVSCTARRVPTTGPLGKPQVCVRGGLSCVRLFRTPWTIVCQAPLSIGFPGQESWSGLLILRGLLSFPPVRGGAGADCLLHSFLEHICAPV